MENKAIVTDMVTDKVNEKKNLVAAQMKTDAQEINRALRNEHNEIVTVGKESVIKKRIVCQFSDDIKMIDEIAHDMRESAIQMKEDYFRTSEHKSLQGSVNANHKTVLAIIAKNNLISRN